MPEGHTIHRAARLHRDAFAGQRVQVSSPQMRFTEGAAILDGQVFVDAEAYGKHLFHVYEDGHRVHIHLGLFGRFFTHRKWAEEGGVPPEPRTTSRYRVVGDDTAIDLVGATACELWTEDEFDAKVASLGPDPIRDDSDPDDGWRALQRRRKEVGRSLMDQQVVAGVGNVYRAEVLFVHGIHPSAPSEVITREQFDAMWSSLRDWMRRDQRNGRITTTDPDEIGKVRSRMNRSDRLYVYKQDRCRRCQTEIRRWDLAGRWAYACETCQVPPERR